MRVFYKDGEPCDHPGCTNHISHPCEICGRVGAKGEVLIIIPEGYITMRPRKLYRWEKGLKGRKN